MTGGEVAAAALVGEVVKHAGEQMAEEKKSVNKELLSAAKDSPYMADGASNYAKRIAIKQAILTKMYLPIARLFGVANQYFEDGFGRDMAEKLQDVPDEHVVSPKPSVAAPAMQQLGFSLDEPDLKEMYLSLLATASDDRVKDSAHPSFVEVIKQLSSAELGLLSDILNGGIPTPISSIKRVTQGQEGAVLLQKHILPIVDRSTNEPVENPQLGTFIDNWIRLGLVEVSYVDHLTREGAYDWMAGRPEVARHQGAFDPYGGHAIDFDKGFIRPTNFGASFAKAVGIKD